MHPQCASFTLQFFAVKIDFFKSFVRSEPGAMNECHIEEISKKFKEIIPTIPDVRLTEYYSDKYLEQSGLLTSFRAFNLPIRIV